MTESDIEREVVATAQAKLGVLSLKLNVAGTTGWPDRLFFVPGGTPLFVEFKQRGGRARAKQRVVHDYLKRLGYKVETHDNSEECLEAISNQVSESVERSRRPGTGQGLQSRVGKKKP